MISVSTIKKFLFDPGTGTDEFDDLIEEIESGVVAQMESEIGLKLRAATGIISEVFGPAKTIYLSHMNLRNVEIEEDGTIVDPESYVVESERGRIRKIDGIFNGRRIRITFDGGFVEDDVPEDLKTAIIKQTVYIFRRRKDLGLQSVAYPDGTIHKMSFEEWLPEVKPILLRRQRIVL